MLESPFSVAKPLILGIFSRLIKTYFPLSPSISTCLIPETPSALLTSTVLLSSKLSDRVQQAAFLNSDSVRISCNPTPFPLKYEPLSVRISTVAILSDFFGIVSKALLDVGVFWEKRFMALTMQKNRISVFLVPIRRRLCDIYNNPVSSDKPHCWPSLCRYRDPPWQSCCAIEFPLIWLGRK